MLAELMYQMFQFQTLTGSDFAGDHPVCKILPPIFEHRRCHSYVNSIRTPWPPAVTSMVLNSVISSHLFVGFVTLINIIVYMCDIQVDFDWDSNSNVLITSVRGQ